MFKLEGVFETVRRDKRIENCYRTKQKMTNTGCPEIKYKVINGQWMS